MAGVAIAVVLGLAAPSWATNPSLSGQTACSDGVHVVHWTIGNPRPDMGMSIDYLVVASATVVYSADGWSNTVPAGGSTDATTIVPGGVTGSVGMMVSVRWPDGFEREVGTGVSLPTICVAPTTTTTTTTTQPTTTQPTTTTLPETPTTEPETPTTEPETPTTQGETPTTAGETPTTIEVGGTTTVTSPPTDSEPTTTLGGAGAPIPGGPTTTTKPGKPTLPRTGAAATFLFLFGGIFVAVGGSILMHKRNSWAALRGHETTADVRRVTEKKKRALFVYLPPRR